VWGVERMAVGFIYQRPHTGGLFIPRNTQTNTRCHCIVARQGIPPRSTVIHIRIANLDRTHENKGKSKNLRQRATSATARQDPQSQR
jgi:hypothetical protein